MKRREALKNIGLAAGIAVATPSVLSILQSCTSDANTWQPLFFTSEEGALLKGITNTILPKTDTPSASEVNVAEFLDRYVNDILMEDEQAESRKAMESLLGMVKEIYGAISKLTDDNYKDLLDNHMKMRGEEGGDHPISQFLNQIKSQSIWAYRNTELVGETILPYDPIPGQAYCGDLQELTGGKSWSL